MLALLKREPTGPRVKAAIDAGGAVASWINVGEVYYQEVRRVGAVRAASAVELLSRGVRMEAADRDMVLAAARIKASGGISYADCFAVATAQRHQAPLLTGDPEIVALAGEVEVVDLRNASSGG